MKNGRKLDTFEKLGREGGLDGMESLSFIAVRPTNKMFLFSCYCTGNIVNICLVGAHLSFLVFCSFETAKRENCASCYFFAQLA